MSRQDKTTAIDSPFKAFIRAYKKNFLASIAFKVFLVIALIGVYAPLFASGKPVLVYWNGKYYWPLFRYLWFKGYYTKSIDIFFNVLMLSLPFFILSWKLLKGKIRGVVVGLFAILHLAVFSIVDAGYVKDPTGDEQLRLLRSTELCAQKEDEDQEALVIVPKDSRTWDYEKSFMSTYEKLGLLIRSLYRVRQDAALQKHCVAFEGRTGKKMPTLRQMELYNEETCLERLNSRLDKLKPAYEIACSEWETAVNDFRPYLMELSKTQHDMNIALYRHEGDFHQLQSEYLKVSEQSSATQKKLISVRKVLEDYGKLQGGINFIKNKRQWIEEESSRLKILISPLFSVFHWEEDAGGSREMNKIVSWWQLSRINQKDLLSSLIFGVRIALTVGGVGVFLALCIGVPIGLISGYFGGRVDLFLSRFTEIWETMPVLFILLLVVSILGVKSLFLDTVILGLFGWASISRYVRMETLRQRELPYVLCAKSMGCSRLHIMFGQILPNAIFPVISLLPFSMMSMISCEAGLTFLGLGEETSASWGALMREGVTAFPAESRVLWPPAVMLTLLLVIIALIGDGVRDALDPRLRD
ncbi:ABC transporter permease [Chlamydiifrater phoenicopteri]|uniref:ABC transporter permease n=1 Tax=Chlamydiifrater phoenicopteri TaxID=2681469 RepID=UPI001BCB9F3F|nr:ABC transporter permease [Chlamydiifrater phoenicopteri]